MLINRAIHKINKEWKFYMAVTQSFTLFAIIRLQFIENSVFAVSNLGAGHSEGY